MNVRNFGLVFVVNDQYSCPCSGDHCLRKREKWYFASTVTFINIDAMLKQDLAHFPLFQGLSENQLQTLESILEYCHFPVGTTIFDQNEPATALYFLLNGCVDVIYKPYDGPALKVARVIPGGVFGWSAALRRESYTSAAVTNEPVEAFRLTARKLFSLCDENPETGMVLLERLASVIAERLSSTHERILEILHNGMDCADDPGRRK